jgi:hypothetical protein
LLNNFSVFRVAKLTDSTKVVICIPTHDHQENKAIV